jgi:16S rRNA (cytosine967-C5)-methyltransferase
VARVASPARSAAFRVVRRVHEDGAFADQALHAEAEGLDPRERGFARQLAFGTVQRRRTLDHLIASLSERRRLDPEVRGALQLGLFQLLFLDSVPAHAAVGESVDLVKGSRGAGLVNAVLRRGAEEGRELLAEIEDEGVRESYPHWLVELWRSAYGKRTATKLMRRLNEPAETALRANRLKTSPEALAAALGEGATPKGRDAVVLDGPFDAYAHPLWAEGRFMPQSRSSQAVARAVDPQPGERVLDLCAAPGGKTTHLAALMRDEGEIVSVERNADRAEQLEQTCARMGVTIARVEVGDAAAPREPVFDRVLADPPCSGLGTLQARPDLRWRMNPERIAGIVEEQRAILAAAAGAVRPGGLLVWSTCTLNPAENEELVEGLPGFELRDETTLWPHETRSAGFQVTTLRSLGSLA